MAFNSIPITRLAASLAAAMGVEPPAEAEPPLPLIETLVKDHCRSGIAEKMLLFCPDAIGQWLIQKYTMDFASVMRSTQLQVPFVSAFPPVTPVNFASIFTGAQPNIHGIRRYEKKLITIDSLFDAFARAGKKTALVAIKDSSMGTIFAGRDIDYYIEPDDPNDMDGVTTTLRALELLEKKEPDYHCMR